MSKKRVTVKVPAALHEKVKAKALVEDVTMSQIVRRALREFVRDGDDPGTAA